MAKKPGNTFETALKAATTGTAAKRQTGGTGQAAAPAVDATQNEAPEAKARRKWDENKCSLYLPHPVVYKALLDLQHAERGIGTKKKKLNDYFLEGIDRVFADRGLPSIEELIKKAEE